MDKEIMDSELVEVIEAAWALLNVVRKLSSFLDSFGDTLVPISDPCVAPALRLTERVTVSVVGQHIK